MVIDIIVFAVLLISALISFVRGFIRETLTILGVVGGLAAAYFGGPMLSPMMKGWLGVVEGEKPDMLFGVVPYPILADILSYGLIFIVVIIVLSLTSHILAEGARALGLGAVDRTLGVIFGFARGLLVVAVLYLPLHLGVDQKTRDEWFKGSRTHEWLEILAQELAKFLPDSAVQKISETTRSASEEATGEEDSTLETINKIEMLKDAISPQTQSQPQDNSAQDGYSEDFREEMDEMFEENPKAPPAQPSQNELPASAQPQTTAPQ